MTEITLIPTLFNHFKKDKESSKLDQTQNHQHFKQSIRDHMVFSNMVLGIIKVFLLLKIDIILQIVLIYFENVMLILNLFIINSEWWTASFMATRNRNYRLWRVFEKYVKSWCLTTIFQRTFIRFITNTSAILPNIFHDC